MHITLRPVASVALARTFYGPVRTYDSADLLNKTRTLGRSLNLYPSTAKYTATTGNLTLEFDNSRRDKQGLFRTSPRAQVDLRAAPGEPILWSGVGFEFQDNPKGRSCTLKVRENLELLRGVALKPPDNPFVLTPLRLWCGGQIERVLGYDLFPGDGGAFDTPVYPPPKPEDALRYLERVLPFLGAGARFYLDNDDGRVVVKPLVPRVPLDGVGHVIREIIGDYLLTDGRGQVWNAVSFETRGADGRSRADAVLARRFRDFSQVPSSVAVYGRRELDLRFDHLSPAAGAAMAEEVLFSSLVARSRVRLTTPATQPLALLDVVDLDLRVEGAAIVKLSGRWVINSLALDIEKESYTLELIELLRGDLG